jgi:hypothetical protein
MRNGSPWPSSCQTCQTLGAGGRQARWLTLPGPFLIEVVDVEHPDVHMNAAIAIYGGKVRALQLVRADRRGRWPWSSGFNNGRGGQRVLGVRAARVGTES